MKLKVKENVKNKRVNMKNRGISLSVSSMQKISSSVKYRIYLKKLIQILDDDSIMRILPQDRLVALTDALYSLRKKRMEGK